MIFNYILLLLIVIAAAVGVILYVKNLDKTPYSEEVENIYSVNHIVEEVADAFSDILKKDIRDMNATKEEYQKKQYIQRELRHSLKEAAYGNREAKRYVKDFITDILQDKRVNITELNIDKVIHFDNFNNLKPKDKFEILLYVYNKKYGAEGFSKMIKEFNLDAPEYDKYGDEKYEISIEKINNVYNIVMGDSENWLKFEDKLEVLAQRVFENYKGFGAIDMILDSTIDEIDCGVSGVPKDSFEIKQADIKDLPYSYESIWIMYHGKNIRLSCISFDSQDELVRVCQNIYRYEAPTVLSRKEGKVTSTMKDGSRVVAVRPPFADSYAFFVRKFDSAPSVAPESLFKDKNSDLIIEWIKWSTKGHLNIAYTGSQGTGKTTTLKSSIRFIPSKYNLRIQELTPELNLRYTYPERNIVAFQETADISSQDGLNTQKKTNGSVNIIGEVATAEAASWIIQTAKVASLYTWFTHHAKTAADLVTAIRDNLLQTKTFNDAKAAEAAVAEVLNLDIHMDKNETKGTRFIERITEIIPIRDHSYPSDALTDLTNEEKALMDSMEYQRRVTDRKLFETVNIFEYHNEEYVPVNLPSEALIKEMKSHMTEREIEQFETYLDRLNEEIKLNKVA